LANNKGLKGGLAKYGISWGKAGYLILANLGYALAINLFLEGNQIAAGGFSGLGIVLNHFFYVPIGAFVFALSIPRFIWAWRIKGKYFTVSTLISSVLYSVFIDAFSFLPTLTDNKLIAAIAAGILYGISAVLFLKANGSSSGTDLLTRLLLTKRRHLTLGIMYLFTDGSIVLLSMIVYGNIEHGIYAAVTLAVSSWVMDNIVNGLNKASVFHIILDTDPEPLAKAIMKELDRGVTLQKGTGMYAYKDKSILVVVVKPREVYKVKDLIKRLAPTAFAYLNPASEVVGEGFISLNP
jgi:uncharacterized membrane-anchored protein YitT (DUF2179 family)